MQSRLKVFLEIGGYLGWVMSASYYWHHSLWIGLVGVAVYFLCNGCRAYLDHRANRARKKPRDSALREILRMYTLEMFGEDSSYRSTILLPAAKNQHLCPAHRYQYGTLPGGWSSSARFPKGCAIAGFSWEDPATLFKRDMPSMDEQQFKAFYRSELKMSDELIDDLSPHTRKLRSIFSGALVNHRDEFVGVLSIDSTKPNAFDKVPGGTLEKFINALEIVLEEVN